MVAGMPNPADRQRWTYAELLADAEQTAHALLTRFEPGEHVAVWAPNIPEWVLLQYGAALGRARARDGQPRVPGRRSSSTCCASRARSACSRCRNTAATRWRSRWSRCAPGLPDLREVVLFSRVARLRRRRRVVRLASCPRSARRRGGAALHVGHHRVPEGRAAAPPRHHQRRAPRDVALRRAPAATCR